MQSKKSELVTRKLIIYDLYIEIMLKIFRLTNLSKNPIFKFNPLFHFSKASQNPSQTSNQNYIKSREPVVNEPVKQSTIPDTITNDKTIMKKLLLANLCFMSILPFWPAMNVGIGMLNASFIMSQIGQQLKKFLIVINNNHYQQLLNYKTLPIYSKIVTRNMLFLASQAGLLAFSQYQMAHVLTMVWYGFGIYNKIIPSSYYPVVICVLLAILINIFKKPFAELLEGNKKKQSTQTQP